MAHSFKTVSLIASSTEIICALGFKDSLVGRSHECDFPEEVKRLPLCTEPKFKVEGSSREIDERVRKIVSEGLSVYRVHPEKLEELKPELIVTQVQCEVCAVSLRDVEEAVCQMVSSRPKIVSLNPNSLDDIWADIRKVAEAFEAPEKGEQLITDLQRRMQDTFVRARAARARPRVAYIEWIEPLMTGGNWMPTLVEMAGGENLFGEAGKHSPMLKWETLVEADPDIIFVSPCGFDLARTRQEMHWLVEKPEWSKLQAVKEGRVYLADGNQYFNRPGPRVVESLQILAEVFHPTKCSYGFEGKGWEKL